MLGVVAWAALVYGLRPESLSPTYTRYLTKNILVTCIPQNPFTKGPMASKLEIEVYHRFIEREISEQEFWVLAQAVNAKYETMMCIYEHVVKDT